VRIHQRRSAIFALLALAFAFRLGFGLCAPFQDADVIQIYLLGLKFYATGMWPYFGPDVVWGVIQIPGALQGLLVGLPLHVLPIAEAPYVLLNLISFLSICLLAWYCCRRLPGSPRWFIWIWLLSCPWTLNLSTNIYNPSYLLAPGIIFFVAALELFPFTSRKLIDARLASLMMGFSLLWAMQVHLSWTILVPYVLAVFYFQARAGGRSLLKALGWFAAGALVTGSLLVPTYLKYGFGQGSGGTGSSVIFNLSNVTSLFGIFKRSLSFAVFDITSFIGGHTPARIAFLKAEPWLVPFIVFLAAVSILQGIGLIIFWFRRESDHSDWRAIKYLLVVNIILFYVAFLFSIKPPQTNHLYITFPIPMIYSLYCWDRLWQSIRWQRLAKIFLGCGIIFHVGLALYNLPRVSLYPVRSTVQSAIDEKNYHVLGERRPNTQY
jgi:hypothetical protein